VLAVHLASMPNEWTLNILLMFAGYSYQGGDRFKRSCLLALKGNGSLVLSFTDSIPVCEMAYLHLSAFKEDFVTELLAIILADSGV